jgi:predicted DNA-binding ribbon-helix-helix protein
MCRLFLTQDPESYAAETRPIRLHGHATSIRLEVAFWEILEEIAAREGMPVVRFVTTLHDEILARQGEVSNFASFLRVTCLHWMRHQDLHLRQIAERRPAPPTRRASRKREQASVIA